ncbi:MAG: squalene/phytoene synthase family protein [Anaerolineae bacterium]|nr:squalene/phytoene synthase family protein [Anaerolineae bacterium]
MLTQSPVRSFDPITMVRLVSRTFALSIEPLPALLRDTTTVAYLMFRVADFLEDNTVMVPQRKVELLNLWINMLGGEAGPEALAEHLADIDPGDPEAAVAKQASKVLAYLQRLPPELQEFIIAEARESAAGMARWQARGPVVVDEDDLDDYMFEVAGRVGHLLTHIFAYYFRPIKELKEELLPLACEFGLALQTVNIIRGLNKDYERGWIYVPQSFCTEVGLNPPDLFKPENLEVAMKVVNTLADKAERHLHNGLAYVQKIPRRYHRLRVATMWPLFFAVRTLAVSRSNQRVLVGEAKITRDDVKSIMSDTWRMGWSNHWLESYYERLRAL